MNNLISFKKGEHLTAAKLNKLAAQSASAGAVPGMFAGAGLFLQRLIAGGGGTTGGAAIVIGFTVSAYAAEEVSATERIPGEMEVNNIYVGDSGKTAWKNHTLFTLGEGLLAIGITDEDGDVHLIEVYC